MTENGSSHDSAAPQRVLLHICCAPCSTAVIERLTSEGYALTGFFHNPNLAPATEYDKRLQEMRRYADRIDCALEIGEDDHERWRAAVAGHEDDREGGARCKICYRLRLEATAETAVRLGIPTITTTLTISPHKRAATITPIGEAIARRYKLNYLACDFKKRDGFKRSIELSKGERMYRQDYCGCEFSLAQARARRARRVRHARQKEQVERTGSQANEQ